MDLNKKAWRLEQGNLVRVQKILVRQRGYTKLESEGCSDDDDAYREQRRSPPSQLNSAGSRNLPCTRPRLQPQQQQQQPRRKWRFRVRPRIRVLCSTVASLLYRLKNSYARVVLALLATAKESSFLPLAYKKTPRLGRGSSTRHSARGNVNHLSDVEAKYLDYIKRSIADGELAYYTMTVRNSASP